MEVLKEVILLGVGAWLPIIIVACIVYGIWRSFTARHEYISGIVCCTDKYKDKTDTYLPMKIGDFTNLINIDDTDYISIFQYGNKEIKAENKDIYDQVKVDKLFCYFVYTKDSHYTTSWAGKRIFSQTIRSFCYKMCYIFRYLGFVRGNVFQEL